MPKRKRASELTLSDVLEKHDTLIARALKTAKGFERQRLSKRLRDADVTPEKKARLEREIAVLKTIDLHTTAKAHLASSLLKVKAISARGDLPEELRRGVPKVELEGEEKTALHNVTSGLFNRKDVKASVDEAIRIVCAMLEVPPPPKKGQKQTVKVEKEEVDMPDEERDEEVTDFEGFQSDVDEPGPSIDAKSKKKDAEGDASSDEDDLDLGEEEDELSKYDHLLGGSSDSESELDDETIARFKGTEKVNLDDISSGSESDVDDVTAPEASRSPSPPPPKPKKAKKEAAPAPKPTTSSAFLPSLMGGYVSGSESASDIDIAPPKKRLGQKQRQAIAEKKYGGQAKHLAKQKAQKGGRDAGWDLQRGAVDGDGRRRTPWKKGPKGPPRDRSTATDRPVKPPPKPKTRDDTGVLHPSWEAAKKAKEAKKQLAFSGSKITFD
ncbi:BUD22 family protein-like protein [Emericellopsis cladophorae]|uniref:BUD22 family protein-like protein n=1 Tax=Emericellopsis cladophorae TaxID=2686198 RepID=A0A9P9Y5X5_9HYPO|nr:BUD22 family protein-like protein [Emericellopsis cladophorae]KAI6783524.1 BUD22 family protein-like protein [Emericellopsis cladophorae]